jgi:hypothetical protein
MEQGETNGGERDELGHGCFAILPANLACVTADVKGFNR